MPFPIARLLLFALVLGALGCSNPASHTATASRDGHRVVHAHVVDGSGGARMVMVPVYIQNRGPYQFALDTGAGRSLVDARVVSQLHLRAIGSEQAVTGISGTSEAVRVRVATWRVDAVDLPSTTLLSLNLPTGGGPSLDGLLGSDILSRFQVVTIDYSAQIVTLH